MRENLLRGVGVHGERGGEGNLSQMETVENFTFKFSSVNHLCSFPVVNYYLCFFSILVKYSVVSFDVYRKSGTLLGHSTINEHSSNSIYTPSIYVTNTDVFFIITQV